MGVGVSLGPGVSLGNGDGGWLGFAFRFRFARQSLLGVDDGFFAAAPLARRFGFGL